MWVGQYLNENGEDNFTCQETPAALRASELVPVAPKASKPEKKTVLLSAGLRCRQRLA